MGLKESARLPQRLRILLYKPNLGPPTCKESGLMGRVVTQAVSNGENRPGPRRAVDQADAEERADRHVRGRDR